MDSKYYCLKVHSFKLHFSPGSFLVRPSEKVAGHYALAFRTRSDIRNWKIVQKGTQYLVHPRPHLYNNMLEIVQVITLTQHHEPSVVNYLSYNSTLEML